ncbi:MAG: hypothetical protein P1U58_01905 [Verrucomicrobiales bacterium]|nr:hypothetical protein [Verrucomicrobiales bacterium]
MNSRLWQRLKSFSFDDPEADFSFSDRLSRENGWSPKLTQEVLEEYRRFLYLCVEAGHPVTPSDQVDQAWHLHLCYTRSYWDNLCRDTLGQQVHHGPTQGGRSESEKFTDWYEKTKQSYTEHFGHEPPAGIWPGSRQRFRRARWQRIDRAEMLMLPRKMIRLAALGFAVAMLTISCKENEVYIGLIIGWVVLLIIVIAISSNFRGGGGRGGGSGCGGCSIGGSGCGGGGCGGD